MEENTNSRIVKTKIGLYRKVASFVKKKLKLDNDINRRGLLIVFLIWFPGLFDPWLADWDEESLPTIFVDDRTLTSTTAFKANLILVLVFKCALCITVSFITDLQGRKYSTYIVCNCVYFFSLLTGLLVYLFQMASSAVIISLGLSFMFIGRPLLLSCIFSQTARISSKLSHFLSSVLVFSGCLSIYFASTIYQDPYQRIKRYLSPVTWAVLLQAFVVLIPMMIYLKKYVRPEEVSEHTIRRVLIGIREDMKTDVNRGHYVGHVSIDAIKVIIFISLLIPILVSNIIHLYIIKIDGTDQGPNLNSSTVKLIIFWPLVAVPVAEVTLQILNVCSEKVFSILSLGLSYLFSTGAVTLILVYFTVIIARLQTLELNGLIDERIAMRETAGPIPMTRSQVFEFYNFLNSSVIVWSDHFITQVTPGRRSAFAVLKRVSSFKTTVEVQGRPNQSIVADVFGSLDEISTYVIKQDQNGIELMHVVGHEWVRPSYSPLLVLINTFVNFSEGNHWIEIKDTKSSYSWISRANLPTQSIHMYVPTSSLTVSYIKGKAYYNFPDAFAELEARPYSVYSLIIDRHNDVIDIISYLIMQLEETDDDERAFGVSKNQDHPVIRVAFVLHGVSLSVMRVGYMHLLWTEAPTRLRTTIIAAFQVMDTLINAVMYRRVGEFGPEHCSTVLVLQIFCTSWHFVLAGVYYFGLTKAVDTVIEELETLRSAGISASDSKEYASSDYFDILNTPNASSPDDHSVSMATSPRSNKESGAAIGEPTPGPSVVKDK